MIIKITYQTIKMTTNKMYTHKVYTAEINKIALSINDDKGLQTFDRITLYTYDASFGKVCKTKLLSKYK